MILVVKVGRLSRGDLESLGNIDAFFRRDPLRENEKFGGFRLRMDC